MGPPVVVLTALCAATIAAESLSESDDSFRTVNARSSGAGAAAPRRARSGLGLATGGIVLSTVLLYCTLLLYYFTLLYCTFVFAIVFALYLDLG